MASLALLIAKGESAGHPFRGNQWVAGEAGEPTGGDQARVVPFASGMSGVRDLAASIEAAAGTGVAISNLSAHGMDLIAQATAKPDPKMFFVDSGAFNAFHAAMRSGHPEEAELDFGRVLDKYEELSLRIMMRGGDPSFVYFVAPDVVGNQQRSIELLAENADRVKALMDRGHQIIVPFQDGPQPMWDAYQQVGKTLDTFDFVVGVPSAAAALSNEKLRDFLSHDYRPDRLHILGAVSSKKARERMDVIRSSYVNDVPTVTADAMIMRSKLSELKGLTGQIKIDKIKEIINRATPKQFGGTLDRPTPYEQWRQAIGATAKSEQPQVDIWSDESLAETALLVDALNAAEAEELVEKGESAGHPFRGNQYTSGASGEPEKTMRAYKLFDAKDGKLYPIMIAKPPGGSTPEPTPIGRWVKAEDRPTKGFAPRPGWHAGELPYAPQVRSTKTGKIDPDRVWAEVEIDASRDYSHEVTQRVASGADKWRGLGRVPEGGYYRFSPGKGKQEWLLSGALKVNRVLTNEEVRTILSNAGMHHHAEAEAHARPEVIAQFHTKKVAIGALLKYRDDQPRDAGGRWTDSGEYTGKLPSSPSKMGFMDTIGSPYNASTDHPKGYISLFSFESQAKQYPKKGPPGIGYFKGELDKDRYVDSLLYRNRSGRVIGILNHFPMDLPPYEKKGNVTVMVDPKQQAKGIGSALMREAGKRWNIDLAHQDFTYAGLELARSLKLGVKKGDRPGHSFRGNQHTGGIEEGEQKDLPLKDLADSGEIQPALFHGTTSAVIDRIRQEGLVPGAGVGADQYLLDNLPEHPSKLQLEEWMQSAQQKVHLTTDKELALWYARMSAVNLAARPILLEIRPPASQSRMLNSRLYRDRGDSSGLETSLTIPPEWIVGATEFEPVTAAPNHVFGERLENKGRSLDEFFDTHRTFSAEFYWPGRQQRQQEFILQRVMKASTPKRWFALLFVDGKPVEKGDQPGHPFRGNQYVSGQGGDGLSVHVSAEDVATQPILQSTYHQLVDLKDKPLKEFEDYVAREPVESFAAYDASGKQVALMSDNSKDSVDLNNIRHMRGSIEVASHNHPGKWQSSFSTSDIVMQVELGIREIRAVTNDWVYSMKLSQRLLDAANADPIGTRLDVHESLINADSNVRDEFTSAIQVGAMSIKEASERHWHEVMTRGSSQVEGMSYTRSPR